MKPEFQISKKGRTSDKITIYSKDGERFNRKEKIGKYLLLGYEVYEVYIDDSFTEINLNSFLSENPNLINDLKKKYSIC